MVNQKDHPRAFSSREILAGLVVGLSLIIVSMALGHRAVYGMHSGAVGVLANYAKVWFLRQRRLSGSGLALGTATDRPR
jgi:hypothetical protein